MNIHSGGENVDREILNKDGIHSRFCSAQIPVQLNEQQNVCIVNDKHTHTTTTTMHI